MNNKEGVSELYEFIFSNIDEKNGKFEIEYFDGTKETINVTSLNMSFDLNNNKSEYVLVGYSKILHRL